MPFLLVIGCGSWESSLAGKTTAERYSLLVADGGQSWLARKKIKVGECRLLLVVAACGKSCWPKRLKVHQCLDGDAGSLNRRWDSSAAWVGNLVYHSCWVPSGSGRGRSMTEIAGGSTVVWVGNLVDHSGWGSTGVWVGNLDERKGLDIHGCLGGDPVFLKRWLGVTSLNQIIVSVTCLSIFIILNFAGVFKDTTLVVTQVKSRWLVRVCALHSTFQYSLKDAKITFNFVRHRLLMRKTLFGIRKNYVYCSNQKYVAFFGRQNWKQFSHSWRDKISTKRNT